MVLVNENPGFEHLSTGLSSNYPLLKLIGATVKKDLTIWFRYKANLIGGFFEVAIFAGVFFILASAFSFRGIPLSQEQRYLFFYVGIMVNMYSSSALWTPVRSVNNDLHNGTLEFIYSTPSNKYAYFVGTVIADAIRKTIYVTPMMVLLYFLSGVDPSVFLFAIGVMVISLFGFISFGVLISTLAVMYKQVGAITGILDIFMNFFAGAYLPLLVFPKAIQYLAFIFPQAYAYDLVRYYTIGPEWQTIFPVWLEWILLVVNLLVFFALTIFTLRRVEKFSKNKGLHII